MTKLRATVTVRLAIGYGVLVVGAMTAMAAILYVGTVGVIEHGIDVKLQAVSKQLLGIFASGGIDSLKRDIQFLLTDNVDQDTEDYLLVGPGGRKIAGNISESHDAPVAQLSDHTVLRYGRPSLSRLLPFKLPAGYTLIVGRDLTDVQGIRQLVLRSMLIGGAIALFLAVFGAFLFRWRLESRIATIRRTAQEIEAGNLSRRIPETDGEDEFTKLERSINQMLDRVQHLMDGVRDVSNSIAHDLRTPLSRIRSLLDEGLSPAVLVEGLADRARTAIRNIDELTLVFDKLLQIAEAESGTRRQSFRSVSLAEIVLNVVELYDASAESKGVLLSADTDPNLITLGDRDLLTSATANLVDNAIKYADAGASVVVRTRRDRGTVSIVVQDNGPGIPEAEYLKVITRFYRLDQSRSLPGNGLGLPIVSAISHLHGGSLSFEDAKPGLLARIALPSLDHTRFPTAIS
jgi:signal transduction histidine kinase